LTSLKVTAQEREHYYMKVKTYLINCNYPQRLCTVRNFNCTDENYLKEIENLFAEMTSALLATTSSAFKRTGKKNAGKFNIPGWNSVVKKNIKLQRQPSGYG